MSPLTIERAMELLDFLVSDNDGKHAPELLELIHGLSSPDNFVALEVKKRLYSMTGDFESSFERYLSGVSVEVGTALSS